MTSLSQYDGSAGVLVDTNVWVDCLDEKSAWHDWPVDQLQHCSERAPLHVNVIVYTELLVPKPDVELLDALLGVYDTVRSSLPWSCAALAARAFSISRSRAAPGHVPFPTSISVRTRLWRTLLLTRDRSGYATYFPRLVLIAP